MSDTSNKKSQADRFCEAACDLGADETDDALHRAMGALDLTKRPDAMPTATGQRSSDKQR
jgi:hypothetical protein